MRKLKSIKQLLEEFPDAEFDSDGDIVEKNWNKIISSKMLHYFGKEICVEDFSDFYWEDQWFEPVKEKKLYAYKISQRLVNQKGLEYTAKTVLFFDNKDNHFGERCPEFDLVFKD